MAIGPYTLENIPIHLSNAEAGVFANVANAGNVGAAVWHHFITYFDFTGQRIIIEPNFGSSGLSRIDKSGLQIEQFDGAFRVAGVVSRSPAAELGVMAGDSIEGIDGVAWSKLKLCDLRRMLADEAGRGYAIQMRRVDGTPYTVQLVLDDVVPWHDEVG